jgi:hypothetical protein
MAIQSSIAHQLRARRFPLPWLPENQVVGEQGQGHDEKQIRYLGPLGAHVATLVALPHRHSEESPSLVPH